MSMMVLSFSGLIGVAMVGSAYQFQCEIRPRARRRRLDRPLVFMFVPLFIPMVIAMAMTLVVASANHLTLPNAFWNVLDKDGVMLLLTLPIIAVPSFGRAYRLHRADSNVCGQAAGVNSERQRAVSE